MRLGPVLMATSVLAVFLALRQTSSFVLLAIPVASMILAIESGDGFETVATELNKKGIRAQAPAAILGKSGVKHEFAFAVVPDAGRAKVVVDTELSVKDVDEMKVLKFYVKVFDVGPEKAVLCVSPKLGSRAATLAKEYGITVLEDEVPKKLIPKAEKVVRDSAGSGGG